MSHHVSPRSTYRHSLTHPDFTSSNPHGLHALIKGYHRADPVIFVDFIWLRLRDLRGLCGGLGTMENCCSIESPQPVQSRYVSLCCTFAAGLLQVCWSLEICPVCPCHPLPSPAYVLSTFLYDILPTARCDASDRQEQKSHETWHQDQVLESGESQVCSSQTASKCFKISVESRFNTGNIWQSLWIVTRESLKSNFRIWAQRISEHIRTYTVQMGTTYRLCRNVLKSRRRADLYGCTDLPISDILWIHIGQERCPQCDDSYEISAKFNCYCCYFFSYFLPNFLPRITNMRQNVM